MNNCWERTRRVVQKCHMDADCGEGVASLGDTEVDQDLLSADHTTFDARPFIH